MLKINVIVSKPLATYKDKYKYKHQIVGVGLDKSCPNNFKVVSSIECGQQIYIELQNHLFMIGDLNEYRLKGIIKILNKLDTMRSHAIKGDNFERLYFDIYSKLDEFNFKKVRLEIEHDNMHNVLDFRTIYYFIVNAVNSYENF